MTERELLDALALDVAEALTAIADREESWAGVTRSFASSIYARHARWPEADSHQPGADSHQQQATIPPADADDAGTRLLREFNIAREFGGFACHITAVADLARDVIRERDEARREAAHYTDMAMQADVSCQREKARADAAEATVRELRALCEEAADHITPTAYVHMAKLAARLRAAAVQPASEGRADA